MRRQVQITVRMRRGSRQARRRRRRRRNASRRRRRTAMLNRNHRTIFKGTNRCRTRGTRQNRVSSPAGRLERAVNRVNGRHLKTFVNGALRNGARRTDPRRGTSMITISRNLGQVNRSVNRRHLRGLTRTLQRRVNIDNVTRQCNLQRRTEHRRHRSNKRRHNRRVRRGRHTRATIGLKVTLDRDTYRRRGRRGQDSNLRYTCRRNTRFTSPHRVQGGRYRYNAHSGASSGTSGR